MTRKYDLPQHGNGLIRRLFRSLRAPSAEFAPMVNAPHQSTTAVPVERQSIQYPVTPFRQKLYSLKTVKMIPIRQPGYIIETPSAPIGPKTIDVFDQRLGTPDYPHDYARQSYVFGQMSAPARLQSVPGYTNYSQQRSAASAGYPVRALKAPTAKRGGGQC